MYRVLLALGSNLGNRLLYLSDAVGRISEIARVRSLSSVYETEPVGYKHQPEFFNLVIEVETSWKPPELLHQLKTIEEQIGRKHRVHLRPREIDIDILLYQGLVYKDHFVIIPHPELPNRRFVLEPLCEIAPDVIHPQLKKTVSSLLSHCSDANRVMRLSLSLPVVS